MAADFVAWHNIESSLLQTHFNTYYPRGYRFESLSIYGDSSRPLFAAVMIHRPDPVPQYAEWGYDAKGYQAFFDKYAAEGYGQRILSVTGGAGDPVFAAVWEPMSEIPLTRFGLTATELGTVDEPPGTVYHNARFDSKGNLLAATTMPLSLDVYGAPADRRYAVVMAPNTAATAWNADGTDESSTDYQRRFDLQRSVGQPAVPGVTD